MCLILYFYYSVWCVLLSPFWCCGIIVLVCCACRGSLFNYDSSVAFWNFLAAGNYAGTHIWICLFTAYCTPMFCLFTAYALPMECLYFAYFKHAVYFGKYAAYVCIYIKYAAYVCIYVKYAAY